MCPAREEDPLEEMLRSVQQDPSLMGSPDLDNDEDMRTLTEGLFDE